MAIAGIKEVMVDIMDLINTKDKKDIIIITIGIIMMIKRKKENDQVALPLLQHLFHKIKEEGNSNLYNNKN
jgi:hypothetical protein